jgi:hypothetical protein
MLLNVFTVYKEGFTKHRYKQHLGHPDNLIQLCLGYELMMIMILCLIIYEVGLLWMLEYVVYSALVQTVICLLLESSDFRLRFPGK